MIQWANKQFRGRRPHPTADVIITSISKKSAIGVSFYNEARKAFMDFKYLMIGFDDTCKPAKICFQVGNSYDGYHLRPEASKSNIYFQVKDKPLVNFVNKHIKENASLQGQLKVGNGYYFIEVDD